MNACERAASVYDCVCVCVCVCVCMCMCEYVCVYECVCMSVCMHMCVYACVRRCMCMSVYAFLFMCVCVCGYACTDSQYAMQRTRMCIQTVSMPYTYSNQTIRLVARVVCHTTCSMVLANPPGRQDGIRKKSYGFFVKPYAHI